MKGKSNKRRLVILFMIFLLVSCFIPVENSMSVFGTTNTDNWDKPLFSSSFIQHWYCEDFDQNRWKQEITMLQRLGINEIILQAVAFTDAKYTVYPTKLEGYTANDVDMLKNILTVADSLSMKVRIGLGFNHEWWNKKASDFTWLNDEADKNKAIVNEIVEIYGNHSSINGWYIPYEFSQITAITLKQQSNLNSFYKQIAAEIGRKSPGKDIMVSPYYNSKYSWEPLLPVWSLMVRNILKDTGVDILALQDAVGAEYNTLDQLEDIFSYTKNAAEAIGVKLYSVTETFTSIPTGFLTAPQSSIFKQLSAVRPYVQGYAAFSINHYQNANEPSQLDNFEEYHNYYITNK
jgi:hypothetical protein